ncbi:MAG: hypothetical protein JST22_06955 [Bacteroidetes bacterium]|nr:hypothetical protein [Bacteroidota bacterium]
MKPSNLHKYLSNERQPGKSTITRMADLGCNVQWLVSGEGEMFSETDAGHALRSKMRKPVVAEPLVYANDRANDWKRAVEEELAITRLELSTVSAEDRMEKLERVVELLEMKAEMLMQENLLQMGQLMAYERILSVSQMADVIRVALPPGPSDG